MQESGRDARRRAAVEPRAAETDPAHVRRLVAPASVVAVLLLAPAASAQSSGGTLFVSPPPVDAPTFTVAPATIVPGARVTVRYLITGRAKRVRVRIDMLSQLGGQPVATRALGRRLTGRRYTAMWRPRLAPGRYTARLRATTLRRRGRARASSTSTIEVQQAPVVAASGVFPVQGPYSLGGPDARFGAKRAGHSHQGQDILAAAGTPVVAPRAGYISWRAYQAEGAGYYVVLHGDDERDYVFMHFQGGSVLVQKGQGVAAGERLGNVGSSGDADGPHLHFEIWPDGWYASKASQPIDPLPDLLAWAAG
jgi:murein DD-endopeptidase MepM/ murein hydrolase activator NlpD